LSKKSREGAPGTRWFVGHDRQALVDIVEVCERAADDLFGGGVRALLDNPQLGPVLWPGRGADWSALARDARAWLHSALDRDPDIAYLEPLKSAGATLGRASVDFEVWSDAAAALTSRLGPLLVTEFGSDPPRLVGLIGALQRLTARSLGAVAEGYAGAMLSISGYHGRATEPGPRLGEAAVARLFESGIMGILICDLVGNIKEANDSFLQTFGYTRADLVSGQVRWGEMTPAEFRHLDEDAIEQLRKRGVTRPWEKEYFHKDGSRVPILVGVAMLSDRECIAFVLDISERRRLEELRARSAELETQNLRIQESNRLKSEFLANMSHELRTPLNSIIGFAELLHEGEVTPDSPEHKEFLGDILNSGRHLLQLINDVLDLAKVEAGKLEFRAETVQLGVLTAEVVAVVRSMAASKQIRVEIASDPTIDRITLDPARLKQVLYNYLSNAIKFTNEGGHVRMRVRRDGAEMFRVEVEDNGIGIAERDLGRLFVEFQQLDAGATKRHSGTGLGLALTKRIVEAQGGSVGVRSTPGQGSMFFATLPLRVDSIAVANVPELVLRGHEGASTVVLVIEDDPRDRALLVQTLHRAGYGVEVAVNGVQALAYAAGRAFDAITLDLLLPDMTGLDVLHRIRNEGKNRDTPVIVVTVVADRGMVGGFAVHDYLPKPINGADLVASLQRGGVSGDSRVPILVVDDDPSALKLMEAALRPLGGEVGCFTSGESALAAAHAGPPRAIVLDLLMPEMDGFEFLARLRQDPMNQTTPVIVWTMKEITSEDRDRLRRLAQTVITKAGGTLTLVEQIRVLINRPNLAARARS
jgi:PAS domain S-box-containing protein